MSFFPDKNSSQTLHYFEKSANYFDSTYAYTRAYSLLPKAKIIFIAADPALRAYSWYQVIHHFFPLFTLFFLNRPYFLLLL